MIKVKFETKQDYIDYCKTKELGNFPRRYGSTYMNIDHAKLMEECFLLGYNNAYLDKEPLSYPCMFVYYEGNDDQIYGDFIYPNDFNTDDFAIWKV